MSSSESCGIVPPESIEVTAQTIGLAANLSPDVFSDLAKDVEYRIREIMQEAIKCMRHSKRSTLTSDDVDTALHLRNVEPLYGFASGDSSRIKRAANHKDLFYVENKDVEFREVIDAPLPKAPLDSGVVAHWLAVEGVQPAIPENIPPEATEDPSDPKKSEYKDDSVPSEVKIPLKHVLSRELQLYFEKITELTVSRSETVLFKKALLSLATDSGLHPLVPYFTYFIADEVTRNLNNLSLLFALMHLVKSLIQNSHLHIEPYLHQMMPSVLSCLVSKSLGNEISDNHWELRNFTADLLGLICKRYGHVYHNFQERVTRTLLHAFLDPTKALAQHYGAIRGMSALGPSVVRLLILPNLEPYLRLIEPDMQLVKQNIEMKRHEAWRVYGALVHAAGLCVYTQLKMVPSISSSAPHAVWKTNGKVVIANPNKRKAGINNMIQQPPLKRVATDGSMTSIGAFPANSLPVDIQGASGMYPMAIGSSDVGQAPLSRPLANESTSGSIGRREKGGGQAQSPQTSLAQAWKKEIDIGNLLPALFDNFGESMWNFIRTPELSLFL